MANYSTLHMVNVSSKSAKPSMLGHCSSTDMFFEDIRFAGTINSTGLRSEHYNYSSPLTAAGLGFNRRQILNKMAVEHKRQEQ
jgi:hypothetical protein